MAVYEYIALDEKGNQRKGIIDAIGVSAVRQKLREENIYPVEINPTTEKKGSTLSSALNLGKKVSAKEVSAFTRQLSTLLSSGIPLISALSVLVKQTKNTLFKKSLSQIREQVNEGKSLTESMSHFPSIFPAFYINMVKAGEASGTIDLVLEKLADFSEKQQALNNKIRAALTYPIAMFFIGCIIVFILMTFVMPKITGIFSEMHQSLPLATIFLIGISNFLKSFWWLILLIILSMAAAFKYFTSETIEGKQAWDKAKLKSPLFGIINLKIAIARFCRTLATLLQSGVPLLAALEIVSNVVNNVLIGDAINRASKEIEEGKGISATLSQSGLFPPLAIEMISIGEQTGTLEKMLNRIAYAYEDEAQSEIMIMTSLLEPAMIIVMALLVVFIVASILLPIFEMNRLVK